MAYRYTHDSNEPVQRCPECGGDLTAEGGIVFSVSVDDIVSEVSSKLDKNGTLLDTADRVLAAGDHVNTYCGCCGLLLIDAEGIWEDAQQQCLTQNA